jgi:hypothetical protein
MPTSLRQRKIALMESSSGLDPRSVVSSSHETKLNQLLAALPDVELRRLLPHLEYVEMPLGLVLYESGGVEKSVYFPTSTIVSLLYVMGNGDAAEIAVIGNEGMVGISLFLGGGIDAKPSCCAKRRQGFSGESPDGCDRGRSQTAEGWAD